MSKIPEDYTYKCAFWIALRDVSKNLVYFAIEAGLVYAAASWHKWMAIVIFILFGVMAVLDLAQVLLLSLATIIMAPVKLLNSFRNTALLYDELWAIGGNVLRLVQAGALIVWGILLCPIVFTVNAR